MAVLANAAEQLPAVGEAVDRGDSKRHRGWPPPPRRPFTHLREQMVWTGLRNRARQLPVWKSQRRSMLWGRAWAEASSEPLPSSARAETWGQGVRKGTGQQTRLPRARGAHLVCVAKEETRSLLRGQQRTGPSQALELPLVRPSRLTARRGLAA